MTNTNNKGQAENGHSDDLFDQGQLEELELSIEKKKEKLKEKEPTRPKCFEVDEIDIMAV